MRSLSLVMSECSLSGRGQGHASNFYIVDLENFATASRLYTGDIELDRRRFVYDTYKTMKATRMRHGCTCYYTSAHLNPPTSVRFVQDLSYKSFCTVAWQLARFLLTRRIARHSAIAELVSKCSKISIGMFVFKPFTVMK